MPDRDTFTSSDGVEIAYWTWGEPTEHVPVVLHHGFVANARANWEVGDHMSALADPRFATSIVEFLA